MIHQIEKQIAVTTLLKNCGKHKYLLKTSTFEGGWGK